VRWLHSYRFQLLVVIFCPSDPEPEHMVTSSRTSWNYRLSPSLPSPLFTPTKMWTLARANLEPERFLLILFHRGTHSLTHSWSWALLEKPPIVQTLQKFPAFYGTPRFIHKGTILIIKILTIFRTNVYSINIFCPLHNGKRDGTNEMLFLSKWYMLPCFVFCLCICLFWFFR
jgi:hypothetical protein